MAKKETGLLGLAPVGQSGDGMVIYGAAAVSSAATQAEQRISLEAQRQLHVIQNQRVKAQAAAHEIAEIHQQSAKEFQETLSHHAALKEAAKGKEYQALLEEFTQRSTQLAAQHLFGITEVSARNIGMETARPLYREDERPVLQVTPAPPRKGLLQRLLGDT